MDSSYSEQKFYETLEKMLVILMTDYINNISTIIMTQLLSLEVNVCYIKTLNGKYKLLVKNISSDCHLDYFILKLNL